MYWIYFIIFSLIVFIPTLISKGIFGLSTIQTQEYAILLLGIFGFAIFTWVERRMKKIEKEKNKMISQMSRTTKDLTHSYSYIGEVNRKLDILMNIMLNFPESSQLSPRKQKELYASIMEAVGLFGRASEFEIRFINALTGETMKEIKKPGIGRIQFSHKKDTLQTQVFEDEKLIVIPSPKTIDDVYACIILKKKNSQQNGNDLEIMRVLAIQALSLFVFLHSKKEKQAKTSLKNAQV
ncbi:MAG: hypothetical protein WCJ51_02060 [Candidatus Moraniibacteriota bacterium]